MNRYTSMMFALALASANACRQDPDPASTPLESAATAKAPPLEPRNSSVPLGFLAHLSASHTSLLYLGDPLPHLSRLARSDVAKQLVADPSVQALLPNIAQTFAGLEGALERNKPWIPTAIVLGAGDSTGPTFLRILRVALLVQLCDDAAASPDPKVRRELAVLQKQLADDLEAIRVPPLVAWVQLGGATQVFELITKQIGSGLPGVAVERTPTSITLTFAVADLFDGDALLGMLLGMEVIGSVNDPIGRRMVDAMLALRGQVSLALRHDALVLSVGPTVSMVEPMPRRVEDLGRLFDVNAPAMLAWASWDLRTVGPVVADAAAMIERWRGTEAGTALLAGDVEDLAGYLVDLHRTLTSASERGEARVDLSDEIRVEIAEEARPTAQPLATSPILALVPADPIYVRVDATSGLGDMLADMLWNFEDRLAKNWLKAWLKGEAMKEERLESLSREYYSSFSQLRDLVLRDARKIFQPPLALVIARSRPMGAVRLTLPGVTTPIRVPVPALALIGTPVRMSAALDWLETVVRETAVATSRVTGRPLPAKFEVVTSEDRELGIPTYVLRSDWLSAAGFVIKGEPGVGLHYFTHGNYLVFSSSTALSRSILARATAPLATEPSVVARTWFGGQASADFILAVGKTLEPQSPNLVTATRALASVSRALREFVSTTRDEGSERRTSVTMTFAGPPQ